MNLFLCLLVTLSYKDGWNTKYLCFIFDSILAFSKLIFSLSSACHRHIRIRHTLDTSPLIPRQDSTFTAGLDRFPSCFHVLLLITVISIQFIAYLLSSKNNYIQFYAFSAWIFTIYKHVIFISMRNQNSIKFLSGRRSAITNSDTFCRNLE